jgi:hypothetical protein
MDFLIPDHGSGDFIPFIRSCGSPIEGEHSIAHQRACRHAAAPCAMGSKYLILVDLIKQESVKLYQRFYSEEDQLASENVGYNSHEFLHYFDLRLEKEEGDTLYFSSRSIETGEIRTSTYTIGK